MRGLSRRPGPPGRWLSPAPLSLCPQPALTVLRLWEGSQSRPRREGGGCRGRAGGGAPTAAAVLGTGCARAGLCCAVPAQRVRWGSPGTPLKEGARALGCPLPWPWAARS